VRLAGICSQFQICRRVLFLFPGKQSLNEINSIHPGLSSVGQSDIGLLGVGLSAYKVSRFVQVCGMYFVISYAIGI